MRSEFEKKAIEKALSRASDDYRLAAGQVSREDLQRENSVVRNLKMEESQILHWG